MKTTIIQLEPYDDSTSARDKLSWCRSGRILLVLPEEYHVLESRIDLSLMKRYSLELGVQLGLMSSDPEVQANAREAGIPLFQSTAVAQRIPWRRMRFRRKIFEKPRSAGKLAELQAGVYTTRPGVIHNRAARMGIFLAAILSILALVGFFLPGSRITLPEVRQDQSLDLAIWASPAIPAVLPSGGVPANVQTVIVEGQDQAAATGQVVTQESAAIGTIKFSNLTSQVIRIPAGTIVLAVDAGNMRFEVLQDTDIPAGFGQIGFAQVQAVNNGALGNVGAGEIEAIEGSLGLQLTVTNLSPTQGGEDRKAYSPTQADYSALHAKLIDGMALKAAAEFQKKLMPGEKLIAASIALKTILEEKIEPAVGQPAETLHLSMRTEFSAWTVREADIEAVEKFALDAGLPAGMASLGEAPQSLDLSAAQIEQDTARWEVRTSRLIHKVWDRETVVALVTGQDQARAASRLAGLIGPAGIFRIENQPAWWPLVSSLPFRIVVVSQ